MIGFFINIIICGDPNNLHCIIISILGVISIYMCMFKSFFKIKNECNEYKFNILFSFLTASIYTSIIVFNDDKINYYALTLFPIFFCPFYICITKIDPDDFK